MAEAMLKAGEVLFVGAGPGDPELITGKGLKALQQADVVVYTGSLVNPALLDECPTGCEISDSAPLNLDQVLELLLAGCRAKQKVVRLHTGDPALYGAIQEQMEALDAAGIAHIASSAHFQSDPRPGECPAKIERKRPVVLLRGEKQGRLCR